MSPRRILPLMVVILWLTSSSSATLADAVKGRWFFGGSLAFHTTEDSIRNNADNEGDPRPDRFESRETAIDDTIAYGLTAGFGLTDSLSIQLDIGYFNGEVGPIDVFLADTFPATGPDPARISRFVSRETTIPVTAGRIIEIPVILSGVVRFRRDRAINPYVGAGLGMLFTEFDPDDDSLSLNERLSRLRIRAVLDEKGDDISPETDIVTKGRGRVPLTYPLSIEIEDSPTYHLMAGAEFFLRRDLSLVADVRYTVASRDLVLTFAGEDQVNFFIFSEELFRPDGSLRIFNHIGLNPNPPVDPNDESEGNVTCTPNAVGDFDGDGHTNDLCYLFNLSTPRPEGDLIVQGGDIDLSGFSVQLGMRFYF